MQLIVPVATSYPHIVQIEGVGGSWTLEGGDLGDLGGLGIANEDICMCVGTCSSEPGSLLWCQGSLQRVLESLLAMFRPFVHR
jgi:hypothetical protein